ncbi:hypothetical protein WDW89_17020 [Deltaproteobacteria bacterium TL4]
MWIIASFSFLQATWAQENTSQIPLGVESVSSSTGPRFRLAFSVYAMSLEEYQEGISATYIRSDGWGGGLSYLALGEDYSQKVSLLFLNLSHTWDFSPYFLELGAGILPFRFAEPGFLEETPHFESYLLFIGIGKTLFRQWELFLNIQDDLLQDQERNFKQGRKVSGTHLFLGVGHPFSDS